MKKKILLAAAMSVGTFGIASGTYCPAQQPNPAGNGALSYAVATQAANVAGIGINGREVLDLVEKGNYEEAYLKLRDGTRHVDGKTYSATGVSFPHVDWKQLGIRDGAENFSLSRLSFSGACARVLNVNNWRGFCSSGSEESPVYIFQVLGMFLNALLCAHNEVERSEGIEAVQHIASVATETLVPFRMDEFAKACDVWCSYKGTKAAKVQAKNTLYDLVKFVANEPIEQFKQFKARSYSPKLNKFLEIIYDFRFKDWAFILSTKNSDHVRLYELIAQIQIDEKAKVCPLVVFHPVIYRIGLEKYMDDDGIASCINLSCEAKLISGVSLDFLHNNDIKAQFQISKILRLKADRLDSLELSWVKGCDIFKTLTKALSGVGEIKSLDIRWPEMQAMEEWTSLLNFISTKKVRNLALRNTTIPVSSVFWEGLRNNDLITSLYYNEEEIKLVHLPRKLKEVSLVFWLKPESAVGEECARALFHVYSNVLKQCPEISRINIKCYLFHLDHNFHYDIKTILSDPKLCREFYDGVLNLKTSDKASATEKDVSEICGLLQEFTDKHTDVEKVTQILQDKISLASVNEGIEKLIDKIMKKKLADLFTETYRDTPAVMLQTAIAPFLEEIDVLGLDLGTVIPLQNRIIAVVESLNLNVNVRPLVRDMLGNVKQFRAHCAETASNISDSKIKGLFTELFFAQISNLTEAIAIIGENHSEFFKLFHTPEEAIYYLSPDRIRDMFFASMDSLTEGFGTICRGCNRLINLYDDTIKAIPNAQAENIPDIDAKEARIIELKDSLGRSTAQQGYICDPLFAWGDNFARELNALIECSFGSARQNIEQRMYALEVRKQELEEQQQEFEHSIAANRQSLLSAEDIDDQCKILTKQQAILREWQNNAREFLAVVSDYQKLSKRQEKIQEALEKINLKTQEFLKHLSKEREAQVTAFLSQLKQLEEEVNSRLDKLLEEFEAKKESIQQKEADEDASGSNED